MYRPIRSPSQSASLLANGTPVKRQKPPSELEVSQARAAEMQALQQRQMQLQTAQHNLISGVHDLQKASDTASNLLPLLTQLLPPEEGLTISHLEAICSGRADAFVTTTTYEFFLEDK